MAVELSKLCDFPNSYLTFTVADRSNAARIQLDARCRLTDRRTGQAEEVFLITPCKSERMYVKEKLYQDPNFDFCGIWSRKEYLILRTPLTSDLARAAPKELDAGVLPGRFGQSKIDLRYLENTQPLKSDSAVVQATLKNLYLMARTHVEHADPHLSAMIEYPVKTMNVCEKTTRFQVDTGPLLWPDFESKAKLAVERFDLGFIVYNTFADGEVVLRVQTPIVLKGKEAAKAWHYSKIVPIKAKHELFCVGKL
ncbi:MAG: hypothetical protein HYS12_07175 [Planctomycetes bacterium]|nr:hypothetical protein [Planctomycetota bacterium]